jgi:hypothetical protein
LLIFFIGSCLKRQSLTYREAPPVIVYDVS